MYPTCCLSPTEQTTLVVGGALAIHIEQNMKSPSTLPQVKQRTGMIMEAALRSQLQVSKAAVSNV